MNTYLVLFSLIAVFTVPAASQQCQICEQIVTFLENWIENNATSTAIEQYLEIVCTLAPDTWQQPCDAIVDYGVEEAIQWIQENENATSLCAQLELCSSKKAAILSKIKSMPADANCDICIQVIGLIENWVESNYTVEQITEYLDEICSLIPGFTQVCDQVVQYGIAYVVNFIQNDENATEICTELGLCGNSKLASSKQFLSPIKPKRQDTCDLCTQFFTIVKAWIGANPNATVQELEQFASTLCNLFPQYASICVALADNEITTIIAELEGQNGPTAVCDTLGLCSSSKKQGAHARNVPIN